MPSAPLPSPPPAQILKTQYKETPAKDVVKYESKNRRFDVAMKKWKISWKAGEEGSMIWYDRHTLINGPMTKDQGPLDEGHNRLNSASLAVCVL